MTVKELLLEDIEKLTNKEIHLLYRYMRRYIIADIPGLKNPMTKYDEAIQLIKDMEPYLEHDDDKCDFAYGKKCTCGLSDIQKRIKDIKGEK